jgi:FtsZ-binding cell division protein ZapB
VEEVQLKSDCLRQIDDDIKIMQSHINELDNNNALYSAENNKLRREIENLRQVESNLRSVKQGLDDEK